MLESLGMGEVSVEGGQGLAGGCRPPIIAKGRSIPSSLSKILCLGSCPIDRKDEQILEKAFIDVIENVQTDITITNHLF